MNDLSLTAAQQELFNSGIERACRIARSMAKNTPIYDEYDAIQDALVGLARAAKTLPPGRSFGSYSTVLIKNAVVDGYRFTFGGAHSKARRRGEIAKVNMSSIESSCGGTEPWDNTIPSSYSLENDVEVNDELDAALKHLCHDEQLLARLHFGRGMAGADIAELLGRKKATVSRTLHDLRGCIGFNSRGMVARVA